MKRFLLQTSLVACLAGIFTSGTASAAALNFFKITGPTTVAQGSSITVTEQFVPNTGSMDQFKVVLGFDPAVFSVSNFQIGTVFSSSTIDKNISPASGVYDFGATSTGGSVTLTVGGTKNLFTFTLTALSNAALGNSNLYTLVNDGQSPSYASAILSGGTPLSFVQGTGTTYNANSDLQVNVTAAATPEPATAGLVLLAAGSLLAARRARKLF